MTADKLDKAIPKLFKLLVLTMVPEVNQGERERAVTSFNKTLKGLDTDIHGLAQRIADFQDEVKEFREKGAGSSLTEAEMQQILQVGIARGRAEEAARHQSNAVAPIIDDDAVGSGVGAYTWQTLVDHFMANQHRLSSWEKDFVTSLANQLARYRRAPSVKQAIRLEAILQQRFTGRI
jgi:hypothetical protein